MNKEIVNLINNKLNEKGLSMDVIKEIVKSNPKAIDSEIDIPTIKHFDFKER